ncbi:hypothetical protein HDU97_000117 [Phlyctochytrium planicorne]|nr:hypothetical protein HDU97_000117 [Phlyctochytrium planicorne]
MASAPTGGWIWMTIYKGIVTASDVTTQLWVSSTNSPVSQNWVYLLGDSRSYSLRRINGNDESSQSNIVAIPIGDGVLPVGRSYPIPQANFNANEWFWIGEFFGQDQNIKLSKIASNPGAGFLVWLVDVNHNLYHVNGGGGTFESKFSFLKYKNLDGAIDVSIGADSTVAVIENGSKRVCTSKGLEDVWVCNSAVADASKIATGGKDGKIWVMDGSGTLYYFNNGLAASSKPVSVGLTFSGARAMNVNLDDGRPFVLDKDGAFVDICGVTGNNCSGQSQPRSPSSSPSPQSSNSPSLSTSPSNSGPSTTTPSPNIPIDPNSSSAPILAETTLITVSGTVKTVINTKTTPIPTNSDTVSKNSNSSSDSDSQAMSKALLAIAAAVGFLFVAIIVGYLWIRRKKARQGKNSERDSFASAIIVSDASTAASTEGREGVTSAAARFSRPNPDPDSDDEETGRVARQDPITFSVPIPLQFNSYEDNPRKGDRASFELEVVDDGVSEADGDMEKGGNSTSSAAQGARSSALNFQDAPPSYSA